MRSLNTLIICLTLAAFCAVDVSAQNTDPVADGILAFRSEDYQSAIGHFERALKNDRDNAEAHYLLARIYWEKLDDADKAGDHLDEALEIDPKNVTYMVAKLQQLGAESTFFVIEQSRAAKRRELAFDILRIDSTNTFAHQELGAAYIRDFWRYRNALMYPTLTFNQYEYRSRMEVDPMAGYLVDAARDLAEQNEEFEPPPEWDPVGEVVQGYDPNSVFLADEFDVETLRAQGVPIVDMSRRAQKAYDRAIGHLTTALDSDPRQRRVYDLLMEIYSLKGEYEKAQQMLSQMYVFFPETAELWTYLGYVHYKSGNMEAASKAFETAFKYMTPEEQHAYESLDVILPEDERRQYEQDELAYASRFWTSKDPRYLTPYNERKLEHYARLTYADLIYAADDLDLRGWNTERGQILVRYGVPQGDVTIIPRSSTGVNAGAAPKQGSASDPTGDVGLALNTLRSGTETDLLEEANTYNIWDYGAFKFVFEDPFRNGEYRLYSPSASEISEGALPWVNDYTIKARETFRETPERYEYEAPGRQIEVPYLVNSFRGREGMTDVYVNYGIPVTDQFDPDADIINLTAKTGIFIVGEDRNILVEQRPTLYGLKTSQVVRFSEANLWVDSKAVTSPPGHHEVSVEFETASSSTVAVQRRDVEIHDFSGDDFAMSDIMLAYRVEESFDGRPVVPSDIVRKGYSMQPAPWSVFSVDQPIYLYFEVYNLQTDAAGVANYEVEAVLVPKRDRGGVAGAIGRLFGGADEGVSVTVPASIEATDDGQYLILDASNQEAGLYTLAVRVTDSASGETVEREQDLYLE